MWWIEDDWTFEETEYFLELLRQFNFKFPIVADRYDPSYNRTIVDLKERFYSIEAKLKATRGEIVLFRYDAEWDRKRRLQLESYHARPTAEQQDELFIMEEIERVTRSLPELVREREEAMNLYHNGVDRITMDGLQLTMAEVINGGYPVSVQATPRKKSISGPSAINKQPASNNNRRDRKRSIGSAGCSAVVSRAGGASSETVSKAATGSGPGRKPKPATAPTHLSSTMLQPIRVGLTRHVDRMMIDYGLSARPNFATPAVLAKYDEIRSLLAQLAEAKKALEAATGVPAE